MGGIAEQTWVTGVADVFDEGDEGDVGDRGDGTDGCDSCDGRIGLDHGMGSDWIDTRWDCAR